MKLVQGGKNKSFNKSFNCYAIIYEKLHWDIPYGSINNICIYLANKNFNLNVTLSYHKNLLEVPLYGKNQITPVKIQVNYKIQGILGLQGKMRHRGESTMRNPTTYVHKGNSTIFPTKGNQGKKSPKRGILLTFPQREV